MALRTPRRLLRSARELRQAFARVKGAWDEPGKRTLAEKEMQRIMGELISVSQTGFLSSCLSFVKEKGFQVDAEILSTALDKLRCDGKYDEVVAAVTTGEVPPLQGKGLRAVLHAAAYQKETTLLHTVYARIQSQGIKLDAEDFSACIDSLRFDNVNDLLTFFEEGANQYLIDTRCYTALFLRVIKEFNSKEAMEEVVPYIDEMSEFGYRHTPASFELSIELLRAVERHSAIMALSAHVLDSGVIMSSKALSIVIQSYFSNGQYAKVCQLFEVYTNENASLDLGILAAVIRSFTKEGRLKEAKKVYKSSDRDWGSLHASASFTLYADLLMPEKAASMLDHLDHDLEIHVKYLCDTLIPVGDHTFIQHLHRRYPHLDMDWDIMVVHARYCASWNKSASYRVAMLTASSLPTSLLPIICRHESAEDHETVIVEVVSHFQSHIDWAAVDSATADSILAACEKQGDVRLMHAVYSAMLKSSHDCAILHS